MECPVCHLLNPDSAGRCDCGYDFDSKRLERSYLSAAEKQRQFETPSWPHSWPTGMFSYNGFGITLYGKTKAQSLIGEEAARAWELGYGPLSYQAVKWFIVAGLPILPLGTFRVRQGTQSTDTKTSFMMQRLPWDWEQVFAHYALSWGVLVVAIGLIWWWA